MDSVVDTNDPILKFYINVSANYYGADFRDLEFSSYII